MFARAAALVVMVMVATTAFAQSAASDESQAKNPPPLPRIGGDRGINVAAGYNLLQVYRCGGSTCSLPAGFFVGVNQTSGAGVVAEFDANMKNSAWVWTALAGGRFTAESGIFGTLIGGLTHFPGQFYTTFGGGGGADIGGGPVRFRAQAAYLFIYRQGEFGHGFQIGGGISFGHGK
jgi:hypothetical protein